MARYIRYRGQLYVAALDMERYRESLDPLYSVDHIAPKQLGEIRTICRKCRKIMSTQVVKIDRSNEHGFRYNFAAGTNAPKYAATLFGDCGCRLS